MRLTIESIASGGDGVARANGMAVFVPRTAPEDVADVRVVPQGRFGRGTLLAIVQPAPSRVAPRCRHYEGDHCGGCQVQHMDYASQLEAKRRIVRDTLGRIGRRAIDLPPIAPSPAPWEYRAKLTLAMRRVEAGWIVGLHTYDDPNRVFQLQECPITDAGIVAAWHQIRSAARHLPAERALRGAVRRLGGELAFQLEGGARWESAPDFARRCDALQIIRWKPDHGPVRTIVDRRQGDQPAGAFEQVNPAVASLLRAELVARALEARPAAAVDAYAGTGTTARMLASAGVPTTAIELDRDAAAFAEKTAAAGLRVVAARVEDVIATVLPVDLVILNPPRAGVHRNVTSALERHPRVRRVLYVSCDPATLARDLSRLPSYRISFVKAFDMFPQTAHVETLCELTRVEAA
jgi:23S rRNA (uracil1939-C5)-methyltransferase